MKSKDPILSHHFYSKHETNARKHETNARKLTSSDEVKNYFNIIHLLIFVTGQVSKMIPSSFIDDKEYWYYDTFEHGNDEESDKIKEKLKKYFEDHCQQ